MRLGKLNKGEKLSAKLLPKALPKYSSAGLVVGKVSSNLIASIYAPQFIDIANQSLEDYAEEYLAYQEALAAAEEARAKEVEVEADGTIVVEDLSPPTPPLFHSQQSIDEFVEVLVETSKHFSAPKNTWKVHANAAKFERQLDEKYGIFRPFITDHPEIETFVRSLQRKYHVGYFSPFRKGDPPIPRTTAVIILFMMQRNGVRWDALLLAALFSLIGLQPWALVAIIALVHQLLNNRTKKLVGGMKPVREPIHSYYHNRSDDSAVDTEKENQRKMSLLLDPVGTKLSSDEELDVSSYDTMVLGSGPATLYTASLLSRSGRKVLVLCPGNDASGCLTFEQCKKPDLESKYRSVPFDVDASNVARINRQEQMMACALCTSTDYQGGIRFAQIGTDEDGHAFEILAVPGMGTDGLSTEPIPFVLRADTGTMGLMDDAATCLGDGWPGTGDDIGNSLSGAYLQACAGMNASAGDFFLSKVLTDKVNDMRSRSTYQESAIRYVSQFLDKCFPLNAHLRSLFAAIGMKEENINPSHTSMGPHVTNVCSSLSGEGMYYPIGGPRALCNGFVSVIEQCGGKVLTGVPVHELIFEEAKVPVSTEVKKEGEDPETPAPRCIGVQLSNEKRFQFSDEKLNDTNTEAVVLSMEGFIQTFIRRMPDSIRTAHKVPRGLPALMEQRPVIKILFGLEGSAADLDITGADFYRLPGASLAFDEVDPTTGQPRLGEVGSMISEPQEAGDKDQVVALEKEDPTDIETKPATKSKKSKRTKFETGVSWMKISFPSAKDPTFPARHGDNVTTCVVTIEADDDFTMFFDTKPKIYSIFKDRAGDSGNRQRLLDRVQKDLLTVYPQLQGKNNIAIRLHYSCVRATKKIINFMITQVKSNMQKSEDHSTEG